MDFLKHRQCVIDDIPEDTINAWISKMLNYLGGDIWLKKSKNVNHPIVKLWNRKDFMATNELINFANAVNIMDGIDSKWTKNTMKNVAGKDYNNAHGAIFEILALSVFAESNCKVIPASMGNPGIDGRVEFSNGSALNLSIKYYGTSQPEQQFQSYMKEIVSEVEKELKKRAVISADIVLEFKIYPDSPNDKKKIKELVFKALLQYEENLTRAGIFILNDELVNIIIRPIKGYNLANNPRSYKIVAVSPMHKNEYKNLRDKLDDACANLRKHSHVNDKEFNGILIHIHENADVDSYQKELQEYINENCEDPEFPIDYIVLYQPSITLDEKNGQYAVYHNMKPVANIKRVIRTGRGSMPMPIITFFLGYGGMDTPKRVLIANGIKLSQPLKNVYFYQKGEIYEWAKVNPDGSIKGKLNVIATGIRLNPVLPIEKGKTVAMQFNTFESDHLEIT